MGGFECRYPFIVETFCYCTDPVTSIGHQDGATGDAADRYDQSEVDGVAQVLVNPKATQAQLDAAISPVSEPHGSYYLFYS